MAEEELEHTVIQLLQRARSRGISPEFIRLTVERVATEAVVGIPCLPVTTVATDDAEEARSVCTQALRAVGVQEPAITAAFAGLRAGWLPGVNLRGAAVLDAATGRRLDSHLERGVRASRLDYSAATRAELERELEQHGLGHFRVREALAIASKVIWAGVVAEVCWSDEPEYTTGYIATRVHGYVRLLNFKPAGGLGGRVFFVSPDCRDDRLAKLLEQVERSAVLIDGRVIIHPAMPGRDFP